MVVNRGGVDCDLGLCFVAFSPRQNQTVVAVIVVTVTEGNSEVR